MGDDLSTVFPDGGIAPFLRRRLFVIEGTATGGGWVAFERRLLDGPSLGIMLGAGESAFLAIIDCGGC